MLAGHGHEEQAEWDTPLVDPSGALADLEGGLSHLSVGLAHTPAGAVRFRDREGDGDEDELP